MFADFKYAVRSLLKTPGFAVVAIITFALGIGATTAVFSVVNAMLLRPLPYKAANRLVVVSSANPARGVDIPWVGYADYLEWKKEGIFERIAATNIWDAYLDDSAAEPQQVLGISVSEDYFALLGVPAARGRTFQADDYRLTSDDVRTCVISDRLWRQRYGGDPKIVGKRIRLFGRTSHTVVGVMPRGALWPDDRDIVLPLPNKLGDSSSLVRKRDWMYLSLLARLAPDKTIEQTNAELDTSARRLEREDPQYFNGWTNRAAPLHRFLVGTTLHTSLLMALGAVGLVLLIAAINIASLQLARGISRTHETAMRTVLGATQWRVLRLLLIESLVLAFLGGALGIALAVWGTNWLAMLLLPELPGWTQIEVSQQVLAFALAVTLLTAVIGGLAPALQSKKTALNCLLNESARQVASGARGHRLRKALVIAEVALSLMLLIGAGLMIRSFALAQRPDPGFPAQRLLTVDIRLPRHRYRSDAEILSFYRELMERVNGVPGVSTAAVTSITPASGQDRYVDSFFQVEGRPGSSLNADYHARFSVVSPGFFKTMGIGLISGRDFSEQDIGRNSPIIVSEAFARRAFPNEDPVGKRVRSWTEPSKATEGQLSEIVGVVKNVRYFGREDELGELVYAANVWPWMLLTVRTRGEPAAVSGAIRAQLRALDSELAVSNMRTMTDTLDQAVAPRRSNTLLLAIFSALAMLLAALGLYGVLSYTVAQRVREIGIRTALGARPRNILITVAGQGMRLVLIGGALGLVGALALTQLIAGLLYGVSAVDPITLIAATLFLITVASIACYLPARRATKIDPLAALRAE